MKTVLASEFQRETGRYQDMAQREPVTITKHDRPFCVLMSFETYQQIMRKNHRTLHATQLADKDLNDILSSEIPDGLPSYNDELDD